MGFNLVWCTVWYHKVNTQQTQKYIYKASSFEEDLWGRARLSLPKEGEEEGNQMMMGVLWQTATARGRHHRDGWRKEEDGWRKEEDCGGWGRWWWRSSGGAATGQGRGVQLDSPTMPGGTSTSWGEQRRTLKRKNRKTNVKMLNCTTHVYYWLQNSSWYKILTAEMYVVYTAYVWEQIKGFFFHKMGKHAGWPPK